MSSNSFRCLEINGGRVSKLQAWRLSLPSSAAGYADAQIDDYGELIGGRRRHRRDYPWRPETRLTLRARFSHGVGELIGTAGFGFWNAPFGDPTASWLALPQACWFFYASPPTDLPLAPAGPGRDWFAATLDATRGRAWSLMPLAPLVILLNQVAWLRSWIWPGIQRRFSMAYSQLQFQMDQWHTYELNWGTNGCDFLIDGEVVLATPHTPRGPLGFVCWLDNQFLVVTKRGRIKWGVLPTSQDQWLEVDELRIRPWSDVASKSGLHS